MKPKVIDASPTSLERRGGRIDHGSSGDPQRPVRTRRRAQPEVRRAEILAAALEVFSERGYRGASLAAVAERVGLTQQGVLHYFHSKDALLIEVLRLRDEMDVREIDGSKRLADLERLVASNATKPGLIQSFTVLSAESVTDDHPAKKYFVDRYSDVRAKLATSLKSELGAPGPSGLSAEEAATLLIAVMDGLQLQWLLQPDEVDMASLVQAFARVLRGAST
jgi:AcrR family transcriptional regulator